MNRIDPRTRLLMAAGALIVIALLKSFAALALTAALTLLIVCLARVSRRQLIACLVSVNLFMLLLMLTMPWSRSGEAWFFLGPWGYTQEGFMRAARITLRANTTVLLIVALVGTLEPTLLGRACKRLWFPDKLIHLLLFTVRYLDVLRTEYHRLLTAARLRGFRPSLNRHTLHTFGQLAGMLLVRSIDRSERIVAAMKCRGFSGRFYLLDRLRYTRRDALAGALFTTVVAGLFLVEYYW